VTLGLGARLGLVRDAPGFRLLFLATLASSLGTWLALVALVVDVYDRTGDATWVSALLVVEFLPIVVVGLVAGPLVDRLPRRSILVGADLARLAVFCVLPFATGSLQIVLLALAAGVATSFFRPAV
jgi:MFS family permease